jgi:hypothetical protein
LLSVSHSMYIKVKRATNSFESVIEDWLFAFGIIFNVQCNKRATNSFESVIMDWSFAFGIIFNIQCNKRASIRLNP